MRVRNLAARAACCAGGWGVGISDTFPRGARVRGDVAAAPGRDATRGPRAREAGPASSGGVGAIPTASPSAASTAPVARQRGQRQPRRGHGDPERRAGASGTGGSGPGRRPATSAIGSNGDEDPSPPRRIPGTVFTAGDNAYENGMGSSSVTATTPSWIRHRATWRGCSRTPSPRSLRRTNRSARRSGGE